MSLSGFSVNDTRKPHEKGRRTNEQIVHSLYAGECITIEAACRGQGMGMQH
ncbi:MAG: hypothetical protein AAFX93_04775 [Verrucomicrobiota bacterium]